MGHPMEPGADRVADPEPAGLPDQDQEGRLEGVLRVVRVGQHAPADAEDHRAMPLDQGREGQLGGLGGARRESFQELAVRQARARAALEEHRRT